jgi:protein phosphatase
MENEHVTPNFRIGAYYGVGAVPVAIIAAATWPWGAPLAWGALGLAIQAAGYFGVGPRIHAKRDGRLPLITRILLGPILVGQYVSLLYYRRQGNAWDEAVPGLLMGQLLDDRRAKELLDAGATAVLDLTSEFSEVALLRDKTNYCNLPILDLTAPTPAQLQRAIDFIQENARDGVVYVHCKAGYSRTAAVVGAFLMATGQSDSVDAAMAHMRDARSPLVIRPEVVAALQGFEASLR